MAGAWRYGDGGVARARLDAVSYVKGGVVVVGDGLKVGDEVGGWCVALGGVLQREDALLSESILQALQTVRQGRVGSV